MQANADGPLGDRTLPPHRHSATISDSRKPPEHPVSNWALRALVYSFVLPLALCDKYSGCERVEHLA
jgi:hypothetical protein